MHLRRATEADIDPVLDFTSDTWPDRDLGDYIPRYFPEWVATDDERQATMVLDAREGGSEGAPDTDDIAGIVQGERLTDHQGWVQGLRVNPAFRGEGCGARLLDAALDFCADAGASVARCLVFSWNTPSLGLCRSVGFEPVGQFRWAYPSPRVDADPDAAGTGRTVHTDDADPDAAWDYWSASEARTHLAGVGLDGDEVWAISELTRADFRAAAAKDGLVTVADGGSDEDRDGRAPLRGTTFRVRTFERPTGEAGASETWAEYAVGAWADPAAARALLRAAARDAGGLGADRARMLIPESARWISDAALARCGLADEPDFVLAAPLER